MDPQKDIRDSSTLRTAGLAQSGLYMWRPPRTWHTAQPLPAWIWWGCSVDRDLSEASGRWTQGWQIGAGHRAVAIDRCLFLWLACSGLAHSFCLPLWTPGESMKCRWGPGLSRRTVHENRSLRSPCVIWLHLHAVSKICKSIDIASRLAVARGQSGRDGRFWKW